MPKEEWGVKRVCPNCSTRFYDLKQDPMTCPACEHTVSLDVLTGAKPKATAASTAAKSQKQKEPVEDEVEVLEDDDDTTDVDLGDDVLEDDDDDTVDLEEIADVPAEDDES